MANVYGYYKYIKDLITGYIFTLDETAALSSKAPKANPTFTTPTLGDASATSISFGPGSAATGSIRLKNADPICARNGANSADRGILSINAADVVQLGQAIGASVANDGTLTLGGLQTGLLVVTSNYDHTAVFVMSNLVVYELSDPDIKYSVVAGTASSTNVYGSGGDIILENKSGGTRSYYITHIK